MSHVPPSDPGRDARLARYEREGRPTSIAERCRHLASVAPDASAEATVVALTLAATPAETAGEFADKVDALRRHVVALPGPLRAHVVALAEAALAAETAQLLSSGRPPHGQRIGAWLGESGDPSPWEIERVPPDEIELRAAAQDALVDVTLVRALRIVLDLIGMPLAGIHAEGAYASLQQVAFTLCAEPAASWSTFEELRRLHAILWRTLRRRRPLGAAVIRARLLGDRKRLAGTAARTS